MTGQRPEFVAPIRGLAAMLTAAHLAEQLPKLAEQVRAGRVHPDHLADVQRGQVAAQQVADAWRAWFAEQAEHEAATTADAIATAEAAVLAAGSGQEVDTVTAAAALGVGRNWVCQLLRSGDLDGRRVGRTWLVPVSALTAYKGVRVGRVGVR